MEFRQVNYVNLKNVKKCHDCQTSVTAFWKKKAHCFECGNGFCVDCVSNTLQVPRFGHREPVKVCNECYIYLCAHLEDTTTLRMQPLDRLKSFMQKRGISQVGCVEKKDLCDKIVAYYVPRPPEPQIRSTLLEERERELEQARLRQQREREQMESQRERERREQREQLERERREHEQREQERQEREQMEQQQREREQRERREQQRQEREQGEQAEQQREAQQKTPENNGGHQSLETRSVSDLKTILHNNGVDYSDCIEKSDLIAKIMKFCPQVLAADSDNEMFEVPESERCIICFERRIDCVLLECGHLALCKICAKQVADCPICRRKIVRVVPIYHANK